MARPRVGGFVYARAASYSPVSVLTHEVAYGSLLHERRRDLHAQIVEAIERLHAERLPEHVERLAHHAFRGEVWAKALTYLRQAGLRAVARSAHRDAIAHHGQALAALRHLPAGRETTVLAVNLRLELAFALAQSARYGDILQRMKEAEPLAESVDDRSRLGQVLLRMAQALRLTGDYADALRVGHRAVTVAAELGGLLLRSGTRHRLGQIYFAAGEYPRAVALLREGIDLLGELAGTADELGYVHGVGPHAWLAYMLAFLGEFDEAIPLARRALRLAESGGRPGDLIVSLGALGAIHLVRGDHHEAIPILERGLALCRSWGILDWSPTIASGLATAYAHEGRITEAIALHQRAGQDEAQGTQGTPTVGVLRLGETYLLAHRVDDARACAERALSFSRTAGERTSEARALRLLGEVEACGDSPGADQAERHFREALARSEQLGLRSLVAHCHLDLGKLYARSGQRPGAQEHLAIATTMYREMGMRFWLEKAGAGSKDFA